MLSSHFLREPELSGYPTSAQFQLSEVKQVDTEHGSKFAAFKKNSNSPLSPAPGFRPRIIETLCLQNTGRFEPVSTKTLGTGASATKKKVPWSSATEKSIDTCIRGSPFR